MKRRASGTGLAAGRSADTLPSSSLFTQRKPAPVVVGTGLIALDVVVSDGASPRLWAGGSCGNVLAALSYLGWKSVPVSRLDIDSAGEYVAEDLSRWGVAIDFLQLKPHTRTPIIIHHIRRSREGLPYHRFSWSCPQCGNWFPGYRPIVLQAAQDVAQRIKPPSVFFFDRVSPAALQLAKAWSARGSVVIFEPSSVRDERLYKEAIGVAHILKYSEERGRHLAEVRTSGKPLLEIQTMGPDGLRFRSSLSRYSTKTWEYLSPFPVEQFRDAGGAGDWCTAGLIHALAADGRTDFLKTGRKKLVQALNFSQALASWSCRFEGARGGMYAVSRRTFQSQVSKILARARMPTSSPNMGLDDEAGLFKEICRGCQDS